MKPEIKLKDPKYCDGCKYLNDDTLTSKCAKGYTESDGLMHHGKGESLFGIYTLRPTRCEQECGE